MLVATSQNALSSLAKKIEQDIQVLALRPGDRYRTAAEVASLLESSTATVHRAMSLLVRRGWLTREHGRGTFVGPAVKVSKTARVKTIYVFEEEQPQLSNFQLNDVLKTIHQKLVGVNVQFCFVPTLNGLDYVRSVVEAAQQAGQFAGAIPISCPREIYQYLASTGVPMVVLGSLYLDQNLPSVDTDFYQVGLLMCRHLIEQGHRKLVLFSGGTGRPGDSALLDGAAEALTEAGLPPNALILRIYPRDTKVFAAQIRQVLQRQDRPTGVCCHGDRLVGPVVRIARELGLSVPKDLEIVSYAESPADDEEEMAQSYVQPRVASAKITAIVDLMQRLMSGQVLAPEERKTLIPVELKLDDAPGTEGPGPGN